MERAGKIRLSPSADPRYAYGYEAALGRTAAAGYLNEVGVAEAVAETVAVAGALRWASFRYLMLGSGLPAGTVAEIEAAAVPLGLGVVLDGHQLVAPREQDTDWYTASLKAATDPSVARMLVERAELFGRPEPLSVPAPQEAPKEAPQEPAAAAVEADELAPDETEADLPIELEPQDLTLDGPVEVPLDELLTLDEGRPSSDSLPVPPVAILARDGRHYSVHAADEGGYLLRGPEGDASVEFGQLADAMEAGELSLIGRPGTELEKILRVFLPSDEDVPTEDRATVDDEAPELEDEPAGVMPEAEDEAAAPEYPGPEADTTEEGPSAIEEPPLDDDDFDWFDETDE